MTKSKPHIAKAHDHFFRMAMADKRVAREFFEAHLPEDLRQVVDLTQLELQLGSYIDDMRQESIADVLYKTVMSEQEAYFYLVVDHQSQPDELMPFRILKYICNIIDQHLKDHDSKRIPLILPLVVYHGRQPWHYSTNINDLVEGPKDIVETYFLRPFTLIDLSRIEDSVLKKNIWAGVMELTLKHIFARDMLPYLYDIIELIKRLENANGKNFAEIVLIYILDRGELGNKDAFLDLVKTELSRDIGGAIMTIAEQLKAEGKQKGLEEGMQKGMQKGIEKGTYRVARNLLEQGSDIEFVARVTALDISEIVAIKRKEKVLV